MAFVVTRGLRAILFVLAAASAARAQPAEPLPPPPPPPPADVTNLPPVHTPPVQPSRPAQPAQPSQPAPRGGARTPVPHAPARPPASPPAQAPPAPPRVIVERVVVEREPREPPEPSESADHDHTMGAHTFLVPSLQDSAFVLTHAGLRQGLVWKSIPNLPAGRMGTLSVSTSGIREGADGGVRLTDWLGLTLGGAAYVLTGANVQSLAGFGGEYEYGANVGLAARIVRVERTRTYLGAHVRAQLSGGRLITERAFVDAMVDQPPGNPANVLSGPTGNTLLTPTSAMTFSGSLNLAQTITRALGLQAQLGLAYAGATVSPYELNSRSIVDRRVTRTIPSLALALDLDGRAHHVPLALMLEYAISSVHRKDEAAGTNVSRTQHALALGGYYVPRRELQLGVVGTARLPLDPVDGVTASGAVSPSDPPSTYAIELVGRYIW